MLLSKPASEIDTILTFWSRDQIHKKRGACERHGGGVAVYCGRGPPRGQADGSVCNHGASESTPRLNEKGEFHLRRCQSHTHKHAGRPPAAAEAAVIDASDLFQQPAATSATERPHHRHLHQSAGEPPHTSNDCKLN